MAFRVIARLVAILWLVGAVGPGVGTGAQSSARSKARGQKPVATKPYTMDRLLAGLVSLRNGDFTEPALIRQLAKDGVIFSSSPENLDRLRKAGASNALIEAVQKLAPAPTAVPPPIAKPKSRGDLELTCAPAECQVTAGGAPVRTTNEGKLRITGIPEGDLSVSVAKSGFTISETQVHIENERTTRLRVELKPTRAAMELWGEQLHAKALQSLGGETALGAMKEMFATGDCTVWGQDGKPYPSSIEMLIRAQGKAFFRTRAGRSGSFEADYLPVFHSKTNFPEQQARALDAGLRLLNEYQLAALLERMKRPAMTLIADGPVPAGLDGAVFHAENSTDQFSVILDGDGRPKEITQAGPLGKGVRAEYSDYKLEKSGYVPTRMMVVWPGTPQQGISIHFVAIELTPDKSKDSLNSLKKRRRLW